MAERGAVLVATDYEGLGTPGVPTGTVALAEGHAVLDSVRAAAALPNVGTLGDVVLAGHSQGGRAALIAAEIGPTYAPELDLVGVVALAPGAELPALVDHLAASPAVGVALIGAIGLRAGYPDLDLSTMFTASAIADIPRVETECVDTTVPRYQSLPSGDVILRDPSGLPEVQRLLEENSPGAVAPPVPVFIAHGDADQQIPVALSGRLQARYCRLGVMVTRRVYPGVDHGAVIDAAIDTARAFIADRYDHRPASTTCG